MSKEAENIISLINKGTLPPINQNETFGINTSTLSSSNKSEIKKQVYKEFAEKLEDKLHDNCRIVTGDNFLQGYYRADVHKCIDEILENIKQ